MSSLKNNDKRNFNIVVIFLVIFFIIVVICAIIGFNLGSKTDELISEEENIPKNINKKKIAVCLYGQPRHYNSTSYESIKKFILDPFEPDVFFHTWWSRENIGTKYITDPRNKNVNVGDDVENELIRLYKPKIYRTDPVRKFKPPKIIVQKKGKLFANNITSMWYSIQQTKSMKSEYEKLNGFTYDFVIRLRFDHYIYSFPDISTFSSGIYYIPTCFCLVSDNMSVCSSDIFDKIADLYTKMEKVFDENSFNSNILFETIHVKYFDSLGIPSKTMYTRQKFIRSYKDKFDIENIQTLKYKIDPLTGCFHLQKDQTNIQFKQMKLKSIMDKTSS